MISHTKIPTVRDVLEGGDLLVHEAALDRRAEARSAPPTTSGRVAVLSVLGPLRQRGAVSWFGEVAGYDSIEAAFDKALAAADAVVLRIDSPGGVAAGCFAAVERMRAAAARSGRPVVAYADEMAASAAYALACVATAGIVVPRSGEVGSIGVLSVHHTIARALDEDGIDVRVFRSGKRKAEGSTLEPLTDAAAKSIQGRVDDLASQFFDLVARARGKSAAEIKGHQGAIFGAEDAVRLGLADRIGSLEDAIALASSAARRPAATTSTKASAPTPPARRWADMSTDEKTDLRRRDPAAFDALLALHRAERGTGQRRGIAPRADAPATTPATSWASMTLDEKLALARESPERAAKLAREHKEARGR